MVIHAPIDQPKLVRQLKRSPAMLAALVDGVKDDDWPWRPATGHWALVEILGHLAREEREDFRPRLERTLRDPTEPWPPIDPEGDVV